VPDLRLRSKRARTRRDRGLDHYCAPDVDLLKRLRDGGRARNLRSALEPAKVLPILDLPSVAQQIG
jgi:hypothetical protein